MSYNTIQQSNGAVQQHDIPNEKTGVDESKHPFRSLAPVDDADTTGHYCKALTWALESREENDIKNIALTGPYGSGKSSILKTFVKKAKKGHKEFHFLQISLATFKESFTKDHVENSLKQSGEEQNMAAPDEVLLLRQIEYSILQQIFYHVKHEDIPHTRFRKQRNLSEETARKWTTGVCLFVLSLLFEVYHKELWQTIRITPIPALQIYYHGIAWLFIAICGYNFVKQSVHSLHTIKLRKFTFKNAEFSVDNLLDKSVLNEHLDEILYFFEATAYNVVIFEDLDRFEQTEIFTKLREINQLINNKANRKSLVTFIYAIRDNMFLDRNRTKFFDFIIPVIPVVSPSNSNDILRRLVKENGYNINPDLLDGIAAYVDDMRLLYNIMNEYYIYQKSLPEKLDPNKLLALILYKNAYPSDFVALSNREGALYKVITEKDQIIAQHVQEIENSIKELKTNRIALNSSLYLDERNLRKLYLLEVMASFPLFTYFEMNGSQLNIEDMLNESNFNYLVKSRTKAVVLDPNTYEKESYYVDFPEIQNKVDQNFTYHKKLEQLTKFISDEQNDLELQIEQLEEEKKIVGQSSIRILMENNNFNISDLKHKQQQLVSILMRSGYIDENYESYISIFYPESINRADADFLLNVQAHIRTDFDYKLTHYDVLVNKIKETEFEQEFVLNFGLIDYLLTKKAPLKIRNKVFLFLSNESEISLAFFDGYLMHGKKTDQFINALAAKWHGMWQFLAGQSSAGTKATFDLDYFFELIINHANVTDIQKMAQNSDLAAYISNKPTFLSLPAKGTKIPDIIKALNIKFKDLEFENSPKEMLDFVYASNSYELNANMLYSYFTFLDGFNQEEFWSQNYTRLDTNQTAAMKNYIENNLTQYIENVWLKLEQQQNEENYVFTKFMESNDLSKELKYAIIKKCNSRVYNTNSIGDVEIVQRLIETNKIEPTWPNLLWYYKHNGENFDRVIINYLNTKKNTFDLQIQTLDKTEVISDELVHDFAEAMILCDKITDTLYGDLLKCIPWNYENDLNFAGLSETKVEELLVKLDPNRENFKIIKDHFPSLRMSLLAKHPERFINEIDQYALDGEDIEEIITTSRFDSAQKSTILAALKEYQIIKSHTLLQVIAETAYGNDEFVLSDRIITEILINDSIPIEQKIDFTYRIFERLSTFETQRILRRWEAPYNQLGEFYWKTTTIKRTKINSEFADFLKKIGLVKHVDKTTKLINLLNT